MTKADLILRVAEKEHIPIRAATTIVGTFFNCMIASMESAERIEIRGFGVFSIRDYNAYKDRNPTGQTVDVPPKKMPHFKVRDVRGEQRHVNMP